MTKIYIDTNIFFNVWNEETDPKSGKELWRSSRDILENQMEYELDPYDSIAFAIAQTAGCEIFITRDEKLIRNIRPKMRGAKPEEILD